MNRLKRFLMFSGVLILCCGRLAAAEPGSVAAETNSQEVLRSYLQLQEQIHGTQLAIEQSRKEAEAATVENARVFAEKMTAIEATLSAQRSRELDAMQSANKVMLIVAGTFAGIGLCAMLLMAYFQSKAVSRLADISTALPVRRSLAPAQIGYETSAGGLGALSPAEQSSLRLLGALERLEKRMYELEHTTVTSSVEVTDAGSTNGNGLHGIRKVSAGGTLLARGQELLDAGKAGEALKCFEEAVFLDGSDAEALVKQGAAMEKLKRLEEAIGCYDRAIAIDDSLTIAYLYKAGLCNRMERFSEALACYEKALQTQEKQPT